MEVSRRMEEMLRALRFPRVPLHPRGPSIYGGRPPRLANERARWGGPGCGWPGRERRGALGGVAGGGKRMQSAR